MDISECADIGISYISIHKNLYVAIYGDNHITQQASPNKSPASSP